MSNKNSFYDNSVVKKPWGYEYTIYRNSNKLSITLLRINFNQRTSLHCHPKKKTGFIILDGKAQIQLGLYKANSEYYSAPSKLMIRTGLFHSIKAVSKKGIYALEFENPVNKFDLIRFKDNYGREYKPYEGKSFAKKIDSKFIKFKNPDFKTSQFYRIGKVKISLEKHKDFKRIINKNDKTIFAILNGKIVDRKGRNVISYGDIIKTGTFRKLSEIFKIKRQLTILRVYK